MLCCVHIPFGCRSTSIYLSLSTSHLPSSLHLLSISLSLSPSLTLSRPYSLSFPLFLTLSHSLALINSLTFPICTKARLIYCRCVRLITHYLYGLGAVSVCVCVCVCRYSIVCHVCQCTACVSQCVFVCVHNGLFEACYCVCVCVRVCVCWDYGLQGLPQTKAAVLPNDNLSLLMMSLLSFHPSLRPDALLVHTPAHIPSSQSII